MQPGNGVSWNDYRGLEGFGAGSQEQVQELMKALTVGNSINPPGSAVAGDGFSMRVESLESTLKNVTFRMEDFNLWRMLPKLPAYNTVEEHNQVSSFGSNPDKGFFAEGALPNADDSTYSRQFAIVKLLGTTRAVSHLATMVKPAHGDLIAQETVAGTMDLLHMMERYLWFGNSTLNQAAANGLQFDGFISLINQKSPTSNIIDMRGLPLSEDSLTDTAMTVYDSPNFGSPTHLFCTPKAKGDLCKTFFPKERFDMAKPNDDGTVGLDISGFTSPAGYIRFVGNKFLNDITNPNTVAIGPSTQIPSTPTISSAPAAGSDAASMFGSSDVGTYFYLVVAVNQYGRSAPVIANASALSVAAGQSVSFGVTPGSVLPDYYEVHRTAVNGAQGTQKLILRVANVGGSGATTITDENANLPGTSQAVLFQLNQEAISFKQLAPMIKIPLSIVDTSIRWMQLIYGTPVLYTPGKIALIKNIGRAANYVGAAI